MKTWKLIAVASLLFSVSLTSPAETTNKLTAAKTYTEQQAQALNRKAERQFHQLGKKLDDLKAQAQKQTGDARTGLDKKVAQAQQKIDELKPKLAELKTATTNAWAEVKSAFDKGLKDLNNALQ
jgi:chromosome segregation ATPase